ncbi:hypothetical protein QZH41_005206 [Actinostola sp. cb2023]|nr:hypothetical protein QZH41_005206 [Actinostola sp. cb2023]
MYVNVPVLPTGTVLVPNTLALVATFTLSGAGRRANNRAAQNLGRTLIAKRIVRVGDKEVECLARPDLVELYADLWRPKEERAHFVEQGIQTVEVAKHRAAAGDKNTTDADIALAKAFPKYCILLDGLGALELFRTHGALPTKDLPEIRIEVTLAPATDVIVSSDPTKVGTYLLENIVLEYQTIEPDARSTGGTPLAPPPRLLFNHITHHATITCDRAEKPVLSDAIQIQRRSFVGLLRLFITPHAAGARNTEAFQDPGISKVEFDIDGQSNVLFQHGMLPSDLWASALSGAEWLLGGGPAERRDGFFLNKYAMFIDLRAARDALVHGDGRNSQGPGRNIQYRIHRYGGTGNCSLHLYILSEGAFEQK